ncbi:hypothetical protein TW95_gp0055 [Pandoravirus inopinatum]|uniref:Uncharacterized protein n=1 Tax=Pandoravirus inopinatum TaxID=1605721 RepID=A0A0B5J031_9VIRU|nr:hypothetical protein TW95_gp0055 [Pandoravirus inopinatum]AJF96789.1 hypothetical protein [Pandoravirus inopinatum]
MSTETNKRPAPAAKDHCGRDPARRFAETLAALTASSGGDVYDPYADRGWMGAVQRCDSGFGALARLRADRAPEVASNAPFTPAAPMAASLGPLKGSARESTDAVFAWIRAAILDDHNLAWDAIDLEEADDEDEDSCFHVIEWLGDCLSLAVSAEERADRATDRTAALDPTGMCAKACRRVPNALVEAMWALEQLEEGAWRGNVRARPGLAEPHGEAMCLRLATVAAAKRLAPDLDEIAHVFDRPALGNRVSHIGRVYRDAMRHRLDWAYDTYAALADKVDDMRARGDPAPPGHVPTPRSTAAWFASRSGGLLPAGLDRVIAPRPAKRVCLGSPDADAREITID